MVDELRKELATAAIRATAGAAISAPGGSENQFTDPGALANWCATLVDQTASNLYRMQSEREALAMKLRAEENERNNCNKPHPGISGNRVRCTLPKEHNGPCAAPPGGDEW